VGITGAAVPVTGNIFMCEKPFDSDTTGSGPPVDEIGFIFSTTTGVWLIGTADIFIICDCCVLLIHTSFYTKKTKITNYKMSAQELLFEEKAFRRKLMDLPLKQLKSKCKELKIKGPAPKTKQDACLRLYRFWLIDIRETDIFNKYETERTEHAKALFVEKIKIITDDIKRNISELVETNRSRITWLDHGYELTPKAFNSTIKEIVWDSNANIVLLEKLEEEINRVGPCESKMIENEHHTCRICYSLFNLSDMRMQIMGDCGHVFCAKCVSKMDECPVCRTIKKKVTTLFI